LPPDLFGETCFDGVLCHHVLQYDEMLVSLGRAIEGDYGIGCMCDYWGDNERKSDPCVREQVERLEFALTGRPPTSSWRATCRLSHGS